MKHYAVAIDGPSGAGKSSLARAVAGDIMDGRDIGTVVLPDADVKIFLTASAEERAKRRYRELREQGEHKDFGVLLVEIEERDYNDSHRAIAPMRPAEGAVLLDTTDLDFEQSCRSLREIIQEHMGL